MLNVLFLDTGNTTESLIAESVLQACSHGRFRAWSAGCLSGGDASAGVLAFLRARDLPVDGLRSKSLHELTGPEGPAFAFVITLSELAAAIAGERRFGGDPVITHWHLDTDEDGREPSVWAIRDSFWVLSRRIKIFTSLPHGRTTRLALEKRLHALENWQ
jgi:arsenate reductase (thioredoxin)